MFGVHEGFDLLVAVGGDGAPAVVGDSKSRAGDMWAAWEGDTLLQHRVALRCHF